MIFQPPLIPGILVRRYKRFLADITLQNGETITAHCANTGAMLGCSTPGSPVGLSLSPNPTRKYPHSLEIVQENGIWVGVNTAKTNALVAEAIEAGNINEFADTLRIKREVKVSASSRLDLQLFLQNSSIYVEIKNCSLAENGVAMFPDAVTTRGTKHLKELMGLAADGMEAAIFFLVQRSDAEVFRPAVHIDPLYAKTLAEAAASGVTVLAYRAEVNMAGIEVSHPLPIELASAGLNG